MERELRRTWAEIDLSAVENNYNVIRNKIGPDRKYLAVVKANAYGHGAVRVSAELEKLGADYFGVATTVKIYKRWGSAAVDIAKDDTYLG